MSITYFFYFCVCEYVELNIILRKRANPPTPDEREAKNTRKRETMRQICEENKLNPIEEEIPMQSKRVVELALQREWMQNICAMRQMNLEVGGTSSTISEVQGTLFIVCHVQSTSTITSPVEGTPSTTCGVESASTNTSLIEDTPHTTSQVEGKTSFTCKFQGTSSFLSLVEGTPSTPNVVDIPNVDATLPFRTPRVLHRKPEYLIDIDVNILKPMADKISKRMCQRYVRIWRLFFEKLNEAGRCQLFVEMMRQLKLRPIMKIIWLRTSDDSSEKFIVKNLMSTYESVGSSSCTKDTNTT